MDTLDTLNYGNTFSYFTEKEDSPEVSFQFKHFKYNVELKEKVHSDKTLDRETHFVYSLQKLICTSGIPIKPPTLPSGVKILPLVLVTIIRLVIG